MAAAADEHEQMFQDVEGGRKEDHEKALEKWQERFTRRNGVPPTASWMPGGADTKAANKAGATS